MGVADALGQVEDREGVVADPTLEVGLRLGAEGRRGAGLAARLAVDRHRVALDPGDRQRVGRVPDVEGEGDLGAVYPTRVGQRHGGLGAHVVEAQGRLGHRSLVAGVLEPDVDEVLAGSLRDFDAVDRFGAAGGAGVGDEKARPTGCGSVVAREHGRGAGPPGPGPAQVEVVYRVPVVLSAAHLEVGQLQGVGGETPAQPCRAARSPSSLRARCGGRSGLRSRPELPGASAARRSCRAAAPGGDRGCRGRGSG